MTIERILEELIKIFVNIVVPGLAGITFFALAKFVKHIAPLRALVSSAQTYKAAFWGFLIFGIYLCLRPVQVLAGPHPWPLIISCLREFLLIGIFGPAGLVAILTLCYGSEKISKYWVMVIFLLGIGLAVLFCLANAMAIGGSKEIVKLGKLTAYDGLWYDSGAENVSQLMLILFVVRLINPAFFLFIAGTLVIYHSIRYPEQKKKQYDNMPKKLLILGCSVYTFVIALVAGSLFYGFRSVPDQWAIYHFGALIAGILETISLSMPVRKEVQISEHAD